MTQAIIFMCLALAGGAYYSEMGSHLVLFCLIFGLVGSIQSVDLPCLVSAIGAWS